MPTTESVIIPIIYEENTSALVRAAAEIQKVKEAIADLAEVQKAAYKQSVDTIDEYTKALQGAGSELADLHTTTTGANRENKTLAATLKDSARGLNIFGVNVGGLIDKFKEKQAALKGVVSGVNSASTAFKALKVILASSIFGIILVALGSLYALITKSTKGVNFFNQALAAVSATMNVVIDRAVQLGGALVKIFQGDFTGAAEDARAAIAGIGEEIRKEASAAIELEKSIQKLKEAERGLSVEYAKRRAAIEGFRDVAADELKGFEARKKAISQAIREETLLEDKRIASAEESLRIAKEQAALRGKNPQESDLDAIAAAEIELANIQAESSRRRRQDANFLQVIQRQQLAAIEAQRKEELKLSKQRQAIEAKNRETFEKLKSDLAAQITQEDLLRDSEKERLEFQQKNALESLRLAEEELTAKARALGREEEIEEIRRDFARLRFLTNQSFEFEVTKLVEAENRKRAEADQERREKLSADSERVLNTLNSNLRAQAEIDQKKIELIEETGDKELNLEQFKEREKLRIQLESLKKQRDNAIAFGADPLSLEVQQLDGQIAEVESKLNTLSSLPVLDRIKNKFKNLFNLNDEDLNEIGNQLQGAVSDVFEGFNALVEAQIAEQDALIAKRQEAIDELEEQLNEELELRKDGLANSASAKEAALANEREALKKDQAEKLALEKKAANLRLKQEGLQVASSLLVSVANVLAAESSKGIVGVILAIAAVASIFALIAKARAQAKQFESASRLREGKRLEGPSHERGGVDLYVGSGPKKKRYEAEGGEWLIGSKPSREHDGALSRINDNEFSGHPLEDYIDIGQRYFDDPKGLFLDLLPEIGVPNFPVFDLPVYPDIFGAMVPKMRETAAAAEVAKSNREKEVMLEVFTTALANMEGGIARVEKAIQEQPGYVPITPDGYIQFQHIGNTKSIKICEPPKRKGKG